MRADIAPGATFPDYRLTDHRGQEHTISALQGPDPMILVLSRGHFCPKEHVQHRQLLQLYPELTVGYTRIVTIASGSQLEVSELRTSVGAGWPFLCDSEGLVKRDLDIEEYTDPQHLPMIPHTFVLAPGLAIHRIYNGYWYWGRPTNEELRGDLRELAMRRPDWDLGDLELRQAWHRGERSQFHPYTPSAT